MKNLLPLLFLPIFTTAQTITFHEGAGLNPRHIESLGPDSGWVELWVGPMAMESQFFKVWFSKAEWESIESIKVVMKSDDGFQSAIIYPNAKSNTTWFGALSRQKNKAGTWIRQEYKIKYKKA